MYKRLILVLLVVIAVAFPLSSANAAEAFKTTTELIQWDPDRAYNGYTIFTPFKFGPPDLPYITYMIDMSGEVVHTWESQYSAGLHGYLMEDGNLLRGAQHPDAAAADTYGVLSGPRCGRIEELDWNSNVVWAVDHFSEDSISHHDFHRIYNTKLNEYTTIFLTFERMTPQDAVGLGVNPNLPGYYDGYYNDGNGWSLDGIYEVDMGGNIIWKWSFADHTITDYEPNPTHPEGFYGVVEENPGKIDINWETPYGGPQTDWTHCNSLDYNEELDHIVLNAKHMSEFYVIDHGNTFVAGDPDQSIALAASDAGDFLYRFGNPSLYDQGDPPGYHDEGHQQMYASHDIQWIDTAHYTNGPALPGAGNFLIFDNGTWCPVDTHSEILEIDGYDEIGGVYENPPDAGYTVQPPLMMGPTTDLSNQVVWLFRSNVPTSFYSTFISGCQRLPNGNTLIMSGATGHMFEVTEDKDVVWEYINPVVLGGINAYQYDSDGFFSFATFRCHRYGPDYPGLAGKTLKTQGTITGRIPGQVDVYAPGPTGWGTGNKVGAGGGGGSAAGGGSGGGY